MALLMKIVRNLKVPRWSTLVPILFYLAFIAFVLTITFPMKKSGEKSTSPDGDGENLETVISNFNNLEENIVKELTSAFLRADTNKDKVLTIQELAKYINYKIRDHIDTAIKSNPQEFAQIDLKPRDGLISWDEYQLQFLKNRGINEHYMKKKLFDTLDRKLKEAIVRDKALWMEAARTDPMSLTLDEFLSFRHPESSTANLLNLVDDILRQFDIDGDDHLTIEEFSDVLPNDLGESNGRKLILSQNVKERKEEFTKLIDKNGDGKADRAELLTYIDPRHPRYSLQESATLFSLADSNKDNRLSLSEILSKSSIFMSSKMIHTSESFHDEF